MASSEPEYTLVYWVESGESGAMHFESLEQFKRVYGDCATFAAHIRWEESCPTADVFIGTLNDPAYEMAKLYAQENL